MENRRPELGLILLSSLFLVLVVLSYLLQGKMIALVEGPIAILQVDDIQYPLRLGVMSFQIFLLALALISLDLVNEFFGKREALFLSLAGGLAVGFVWLLLKGVLAIPTAENQATYDQAFAALFDLGKRTAVSLAVSTVAGFGLTSLLFEWFRRMTHNGFTIIRLFTAHFLGLAFFVACNTLINEAFLASAGHGLALVVTQYLQWFLVSLFLIPLFYVLAIPFKILIGRNHYDIVKKRFEKKKIFGAAEKNFFDARQEVQGKRI